MEHPIMTRTWWQAVALRALKTFAQTIVAMIGTGLVAWGEVPWVLILSTALVAAMVSVLMSIADLPDGDWRWWKVALIRAARTFAQVMVAAIGTGLVAWGDVQWLLALSTAAVATVLSLATTIAGLPEVADLDYQPRH